TAKEIEINVRTYHQTIERQRTQVGDEDYGGWTQPTNPGGSGGANPDGGGGGDDSDGGGGGDGWDNGGGDYDGISSVTPDRAQQTAGSVIIQVYESGDPQATADKVVGILQDRGLIDRVLVT
ncbi:MAG TPA: hypothetical protein PK954_05440, partial [Anaerolineales bacterium]|nr:hypothetical protein [Anaerolineales bacterium]